MMMTSGRNESVNGHTLVRSLNLTLIIAAISNIVSLYEFDDLNVLSIECALKYWPLMRAPACITTEFDGYDDLEDEDQIKLDNALWTGEWSDSFVNTINAIRQRTWKRFELIERISRWNQQQLFDPSNETILRRLLTQSCNEMDACLSDNEVERLYSIEPAHAPPVIIHSKGSIHYVPSPILSFIFSFLHPCSDLLGSCLSVSRNWLNIVPISTSCTHWSDTGDEKKEDIDRIAPDWLPNIQHLSLTKSYRFEQWCKRLEGCERLTSVTIVNGREDEVKYLFGDDLSLKRLSIMDIKKLDLGFLNHHSLTHCSVILIDSISSSPKTALIASQLQELELHMKTKTICGSSKIIDLATARSLHTLSLVGHWIIINSDGAASSLRDVEYSLLEDLPGTGTLKWEEDATSSIMLAISKWLDVTRIKLAGISLVTLPSSIQSWRHANLLDLKEV
jgi:hypothetical protein